MKIIINDEYTEQKSLGFEVLKEIDVIVITSYYDNEVEFVGEIKLSEFEKAIDLLKKQDK